jgi:hypothetical protein
MDDPEHGLGSQVVDPHGIADRMIPLLDPDPRRMSGGSGGHPSGAVINLAERETVSEGAANRMTKSSAHYPMEVAPCPIPQDQCRAGIAWRQRGWSPGHALQLAGGIGVGLALLFPAVGQAGGIVEPDSGSLAPIDREAFRQQYGQEGLFRLRLGVDAAERTSTAGAAPQPCPSPSWNSSLQKQRYVTALGRRQYFLAGEALGEWRRLCPARP